MIPMPNPEQSLLFIDSPLGKLTVALSHEIARLEQHHRFSKKENKTTEEQQAVAFIANISSVIGLIQGIGPIFDNKNTPGPIGLVQLVGKIFGSRHLAEAFMTPEAILAAKLLEEIPKIEKTHLKSNSIDNATDEDISKIKADVIKWLEARDPSEQAAALELKKIVDRDERYSYKNIQYELREQNKLINFKVTHAASYDLVVLLYIKLLELPADIKQLTPFFNHESLMDSSINKVKDTITRVYGQGSRVYPNVLERLTDIAFDAIEQYFQNNSKHAADQVALFQRLHEYHINLEKQKYSPAKEDEGLENLNTIQKNLRQEKQKLESLRDRLAKGSLTVDALVLDYSKMKVPRLIFIQDDDNTYFHINFEVSLRDLLTQQINEIKKTMDQNAVLLEKMQEEARKQAPKEITLEEKEKNLETEILSLEESIKNTKLSLSRLMELPTTQRSKQYAEELAFIKEQLRRVEGLLPIKKAEFSALVLQKKHNEILAQVQEVSKKIKKLNRDDLSKLKSESDKLKLEIRVIEDEFKKIGVGKAYKMEDFSLEVFGEIGAKEGEISKAINRLSLDIAQVLEDAEQKQGERQRIARKYTELLEQHLQTRKEVLGADNAKYHLLKDNVEYFKKVLSDFIKNGDTREFQIALNPSIPRAASLKLILKNLRDEVLRADTLDEVQAATQGEKDRLFAAIKAMRDDGEKLIGGKTKRDRECGRVAIELADHLKSEADTFYNKNYSADKVPEFKKNFKVLLHSQDDIMTHHRAKWKVIVANIALAMTVVGAIALAARVAKQKIQGKSPSLFFSKTNREQHIKKISKAIVTPPKNHKL